MLRQDPLHVSLPDCWIFQEVYTFFCKNKGDVELCFDSLSHSWIHWRRQKTSSNGAVASYWLISTFYLILTQIHQFVLLTIGVVGDFFCYTCGDNLLSRLKDQLLSGMGRFWPTVIFIPALVLTGTLVDLFG